MKRTKTSKRDKQRGNVLAYTVISALFLFFAVGLGVDLSHLYLAKTELQNAADAAALAGASALTLPDDQKIATAVNRAIDTLNVNRWNFNNKTFESVLPKDPDQKDLVFFAINLNGPYVDRATAAAAPHDIRFVRVTTPAVPVSIIFASPLLGSSQNLNAKATAGLSIPGNVRFCPAPLSVVQCDPTDPTCTFQFQGTCPPSGPLPNPDGTTCNPTKAFCRGCSYTIRYEGSQSGGPSPGNFNGLDCGGLLRDNLAAYNDCRCGNLSAGDSVSIDTKTGVNAGPVAGGLNVRFDIYGNGLKQSDWASMPPDTNIYEGTSTTSQGVTTWTGLSYTDYLRPDGPKAPPTSGATGVAARRVLVIPIINKSEFSNGKTTVTIASMGAFFMQSQADNNNSLIKVEYVGPNVNGVTGGDPTGGVNSNIVTPVLYR
jgi:Flp pilus assembly protein TadG